MSNIVPGSSQFKERVKRSIVKIQCFEATTLGIGVGGTGRNVARTIGVVVVSTDTFCYIIAPITKFQRQYQMIAVLPNGNRINIKHQDVQRNGTLSMFYLYGTALGVDEVTISFAPPVKNETVYLFSYRSGEEILQEGNVISVGTFHIKHDCSTPDPITNIKVNGLLIGRTFEDSGEVLFDPHRMLVGIVKESDIIDRTEAINAADIRRCIMGNNESIEAFRQRIIANANQAIHHP